jgi:hypothetical protein
MDNSQLVRHVMAEMEIKKKFRQNPIQKPPRRKPSVMNDTSRSDYMKDYMQDYRKEQGKDYQKVPSPIKKYRAEQRKRLKDKLKLKKS